MISAQLNHSLQSKLFPATKMEEAIAGTIAIVAATYLLSFLNINQSVLISLKKVFDFITIFE